MAGVDDRGRIGQVVLALASRIVRSRRQAIISVAGEDSLRRIELKMSRPDFDREGVLREALTVAHVRRHPVSFRSSEGRHEFSFAGATTGTNGRLSVRPGAVTAVLGSSSVPVARVLTVLGLGVSGGPRPLVEELARVLLADLGRHGVASDADHAWCLAHEGDRVMRSGLSEMTEHLRTLPSVRVNFDRCSVAPAVDDASCPRH